MRYQDLRRLKGGYTDFGPIIIPVLPQPIVLTDRDDGTLWLVSWSIDGAETVDGLGRITINSTLITLPHEAPRTYEAEDGPRFGPDNGYVLFVRAGRIGLDYIAPANKVTRQNAPNYARRRGSKTIRQLFVSPDDQGPYNVLQVHLGMRTDEFQND